MVETGENEFVGRAVFSHDGRRLAYERVQRQVEGWADELRVLDLDPSAPRDRSLFRDPPHSARGLAWSRDDGTLYFASDRCLAAVEVATGRQRSLGCGEGDFFPVGAPPPPPELSPDGRTLAFTFERFGCPRVFLVDVDGAEWRSATATECASRPTWLADGRLAYVVLRDEQPLIEVSTPGRPTAPALWSSPGELVLQLHGVGGAALALTQSRDGGRALVRVDAAGVTPVFTAPPPRPRPICDHPHDDLLAVAVEAGLPAALAFIAILVGAWRAAAAARSPGSPALAAALVVLVVFGLTNAPLLLAPSAVIFWLTLAALAVERPTP